jgi:hypothetical protein
VFDGEALAVAVRAIPIPFDLLIGVAIHRMAADIAGTRPAILAAALYLLSPAAIVIGPFWGQVDAVGTAGVILALLAWAGGRPGLAGAAAVGALLVKPQFGLAIPVLIVAALVVGKGRLPRLGSLAAGGVATYLVVTVPLGLGPDRLVSLVSSTASSMPFASHHAFNHWALLLGFETPDGAWFWLGATMAAAVGIAALALLRTRSDLVGLLGVTALLALAVYFLPTRVHERYLFPVFALLAPLAAAAPRLLPPYAWLTAAFTASLVWVLALGRRAGALELGPSVEAWLAGPGVPIIACVLIAAAVVTAWRIVRLLRAPATPSPRSSGSPPPTAAPTDAPPRPA